LADDKGHVKNTDRVNRFKGHARSQPWAKAPGLTRAPAARVPVYWVLFITLALACTAATLAQPQIESPPATPPTLLTNAQQIAALGTNIPAGKYEARFQAVVIYVSPPNRRFYVQQDGWGVMVSFPGSVSRYRVGNLVEVTGTVLGGDSTLKLTNSKATVLGDAPLPDPKPVSVSRLVRGEDTFRYVKVRGMVRDMYSNNSGMTLLLTENGYPFEVAFQNVNGALPREWLDAEIEVTGHCYPFFGTAGRPTGLRFHTTSTNEVQVLTPGIADRFDDRPLLTIAEAAKLPNSLKARYRVSGTVTVHRPGTAYFIEDGTGVMHADQSFAYLRPPADAQRIEREPQTQLQTGDRVEVIGARYNWFSLTPSLMATEFRRVGHAEPVKPINVRMSDLLQGRSAGKLVTLKAQLVDQRRYGHTNLRQYLDLVLRLDNDIFQAKWESDTPMKWDLHTDSYVQITGVNDAEGSPDRKRSTFKLLLRSPADVVAAATPPFWARKDFQRIALAVTVVAMLAGAWILMQRWQMRRLERRVLDRTADLRSANERLQNEAIARERAEAEAHRALAQEKELGELKSRFVSMVSHEFRTPLAIIMSSAEILDAYLDRLPSTERAENLRDIANATRHMGAMMDEVLLLSRVEAGKMTYRPAPLNLVALCERLVDETSSATNKRCPIHLIVPSELTETNGDEALLRHIFTNLLNNAVKYSPAESPVEFSVEVRGERAVFTVRDRGIGIPEADARQLFQAFHRGRNVGDVSGSGLGLVIVKSCVELHHGSISFREPRGTRHDIHRLASVVHTGVRKLKQHCAVHRRDLQRKPNHSSSMKTILVIEDQPTMRQKDRHDPEDGRLHRARGR
jgi:signal transduction histidine kinase